MGVANSNFTSELVMVQEAPQEDPIMTQVHKRLTVEQVKVLFQGYLQGNLSRAAIEELLEIGKTRFFALSWLLRNR